MNPAVADLIKLLAKIAVEKYYEDITQPVGWSGKQYTEMQREIMARVKENVDGLQS